MALTQATASYVIDESVSTLLFDQFIQSSPLMPTLYSQKASGADREKQASIAAFGSFQPKTELAEPSEDQVKQQFTKEFLHQEFALQTKIERKVIDDQRFDFVGQFGPKLGESAVRTFEELAAGPFNEAFTSSTYLGEDGQPLCGTHVNADGGNSQSNRGTTALSYASVGTTRVAHKNLTDYRGNKITIAPDLLLVPDAGEMEQTAFEIVRSSGDPTNGNNVSNFHNGRWSVLVWKYLTDATNWFSIDSRLMKMHLVWWWRMVLEMFGDGSLFKGMRQIGGYFRSSSGFNDFRWIYGNEVAG